MTYESSKFNMHRDLHITNWEINAKKSIYIFPLHFGSWLNYDGIKLGNENQNRFNYVGDDVAGSKSLISIILFFGGLDEN